jgi:hypothetical protein
MVVGGWEVVVVHDFIFPEKRLIGNVLYFNLITTTAHELLCVRPHTRSWRMVLGPGLF